MTDINRQQVLYLKEKEHEFSKLVNSSNRDDLAQCAKFLAMYVALYRQKFGEIPEEGYNRLVNSLGPDMELITIVQEGINEATEMLKLVLLQQHNSEKKQSRLVN